VLLREYEHLEAIPRAPTTWPGAVRGAPRLAAALAEEFQEALLYRKLATLIEDVPLTESLEDLEWHGVPRGRFEAWCDRVESRTLRERPKRWRSEGRSEG
jgi:5'-3' exonuclease